MYGISNAGPRCPEWRGSNTHLFSYTHTSFGYILVGQEGGQNDDRGAAVPVLELGKKHGHTRRHTGNQLVLDLLAGCLEEVCTYV